MSGFTETEMLALWFFSQEILGDDGSSCNSVTILSILRK